MREILGELYATETPLQILFVTGLIGGGAAALAGRAIAMTWRPYVQMIGYMLLLAAGVRFMHFALFDAELLSLASYLVDFAWLIAVGSVAWRLRYAAQMVAQYPWLYERNGPLNWRARTST
ncbi:MAG: hypothetical protein JOZ70_03485 [Pseudolabrys sp.]|nr:hypothetical protein [Pseudolabrys sp.]MBV9954293.1 hypothetical protein [Pseudolabrys sp.]